MALIQRSITVPNHKELMGLNGLTPSQSSLNNFIKDVHSVLVEVGLSVLDLPGSLDLNNIPDIGIPTIYSKSDLGVGDFIEIGNITYSFNDENQTEYPIFLKFTYGIISNSGIGSPNLMFNSIKLDIKRSLSDNKNIIETQYLDCVFHGSNSGTKIAEDNILSDVITCFYNKNNFYMNIFPKSKVYAKEYSNQFNNTKYSTYIGFYVERVRNIVNYMPMSYGLFNLATSSNQNISKQEYVNITNIFNNTEIIKNNTTVTIPLMGFVDTISNNYEIGGINAIAFKTILYDKSTNSIEPNFNILCSYNSQIGQTNVKYEIELEDGSIGKYISYSYSDNILYFPDTKTDFLFRYE